MRQRPFVSTESIRRAAAVFLFAAGAILIGTAPAFCREMRLRPLDAKGGQVRGGPRRAAEDHPAFPDFLGSRPGQKVGRAVVPLSTIARAASDLRAGRNPDLRTLLAPSGIRDRLDRVGTADQIDTLRVAFLRCDFRTDRGDSTTTVDGKFDLRTGINQPVDPPPHNKRYFEMHAEALRRYYHAQSYGHLEIEAQVFPADSDSAFHLGDTRDYGPWAVVADNSSVAESAERLIKDALEAARQSGQVNFQAFDAFIVVHAGPDFQSDVNGDSPHDIPTFVLEFGEPVTVDGKVIRRAMVLPETNTQDGQWGAINGILAHEFGHILGLYDLYNTLSGSPVVGHWSLMDSGENIPALLDDPSDSIDVAVVGALPSSLDPWSRLQVFGGYLLDHFHVAGESLDTALPAVLKGGDLLFAEIVSRQAPGSSGFDSLLAEYYLVENREIDLDGNGSPIVRQDRESGVILGPEADSTLSSEDGRLEYDALIPGSGLLVWHIDDRMLPGGDLANPFGVNANRHRRGIKLVEADAIDDLDTRNFGTPWDPFYLTNNAVFGPRTVPRTTSSDGQVSNITIATTSDPAPLMNVSIRRASAVDGWPIGFEPAPDHVGVLDVSGDGSPELLVAVERAIYAIEGRGGQPFPATTGNLIPLIQHSAVIDPRLAASDLSDPRVPAPQPIVAGWIRVQGKVVAWNGAGRKRGEFPATTPPAIWLDKIGAGNLLGGIDIARIDADTVRVLYTSPEHLDREPAGNVLVGDLEGPASPGPPATEPVTAVYATMTGQVHILSSTGATPGSGGAPSVLAERGSSPSLGLAPLSLLAANFQGPSTTDYDVAAVDRNGRTSLIDLDGQVRPGWPVEIGTPPVGFPAAGDIDGDGSAELVVLDTLGRVNVYNGDGSQAFGFPVSLAARPVSGPLVAELDGENGADLLIVTADGSIVGLSGAGRPLHGYPIAVGGWTSAFPLLVDLDADGKTDVAGALSGLLTAASLARDIPPGGRVWSGEENGPARNAVLDRNLTTGAARLLADKLDRVICFPNPARGDVMHIRFYVPPAASARADLFDLLGRPVVAGLEPAGGGAEGEADIVWNLSDVASGVYLVRVTVDGGDSPGVRWRTVSVIR